MQISQFSSGVDAWCMPAASSINWQGFLEEDRVANFVVLPNYHEVEDIIRDTSRTGADVYLLPKQLDEQVAKLQFRALWEHELVALIGAQVKALVFKRNYGLVKRGPRFAAADFLFL